jgi:alginate O-acetyltransferase complex protein AlgJ
MKKTAEIYQVLLTVLFLCLISCCFLNDVFHFYKVPETSQTENRKLTSKPLFDISNLDPFPKNYQNYFNDQFPFRQDLSFMNSLFCFFVFHQSPLPGEVELGKSGWLFYDQKESVVYQGKFNLADWQISKMVKELHERTLKYRKKGIRFYIAFPPMKPEIYPEFLPMDFRRSPKGTVTDKIVNAIKEDTVIQYIDLKKALLKAKTHGWLYYRTDNHWNMIGAFYGYTEIINRIRKDFPKIKPLGRADFYFNVEKYIWGNLSNIIGLSKYLDDIGYYPVLKNSKSKQLDPSHKKPDWAAQIDYEVVKSTGDSTLPSMVIIRDSFTDSMMPYLDESFNKNTYIFDLWRYERNEVIIDDLKPDIVMLIIFEPHISHLIGK